jgi:hypothetical protein
MHLSAQHTTLPHKADRHRQQCGTYVSSHPGTLNPKVPKVVYVSSHPGTLNPKDPKVYKQGIASHPGTLNPKVCYLCIPNCHDAASSSQQPFPAVCKR